MSFFASSRRSVVAVASFMRTWRSKERVTAAFAFSIARANSSVEVSPNWARAKFSSSVAVRTCSSAASSWRLASWTAFSAATVSMAMACAALFLLRRDEMATVMPMRIRPPKKRADRI